jgi:hypothetical protein
MRRIILILLFLTGLLTVSGQGRYPFHAARNVATPDTREDIHYLFENNVIDSSSNSNDFTNTGMTFTTSPTPPEGSYQATATSSAGDYFQLPTSYTNSFPSDFSITFRVYLTTDNTNQRIIQCGTPYTSGFNVRVNTTGQDLDVFTNSTEINATNYFGSAPSTGAYRTFGFSYESSTGNLYIYVNGVDDTDGGGPGAGVAGITLTNAWYIFNSSTGHIDDFRVFPEILDATDMLWIHNNAGTPLPE